MGIREFAALLRERRERLGLTQAEVAQLAGHANPGVTARLYSHVLRRTRQPATGRLERFYEASGGASDPTPDPGREKSGA